MEVEQTQTVEQKAGDGDQQQQTVDDGGNAGVQQTTNPDDEGNQDVKLKASIAMANAEKEKRQTAEQQVATLTQQMQLIQNNPAQQPQVPAQQDTLFIQCAKQLGYEIDYLTGEQHGHVLQLMIQVQSNVAATQGFLQNHPDFTQVVGTINQQGQIVPSAELMKIITEKPHLRSIAASPQSAYGLVMQERKIAELEKTATANQEHLARQGVDNETGPLGGSAASGGGAGDPNNQQMMSREQVLEIERKLANDEPA